MTPSTYTREQARADLHAVYEQLPQVHCKGLCQDSCSRTDGSALERELVAEAGVELPPPVRHRVHLQLIAANVHARCPALGPFGNCTVYAERPFVCRAFGAIREAGLGCEHGCTADREISRAEGYRLLAQVHAVSTRWEQAGRP